jgi:hypothetical protein
VSLRGKPEVDVISPLCASSLGFTLHAATTVGAHDARVGEPLEPPRRSPARNPPYFKSKALRRKFGELN